MRQFIAVVTDSLREALDRKVFLALIVLTLLPIESALAIGDEVAGELTSADYEYTGELVQAFSLQGEVMWVLASDGIPEDPVFWGAYAELSWWLTGEHRRYLRGRGVFSRVVPNNRFDPEKGTWGAFEIATRYSWLDLSNGGVRGGTLGEWSAALNWVLLSNLRVSTNYVLSHTGDRPGTRSGIAHSWVTRFQVDF